MVSSAFGASEWPQLAQNLAPGAVSEPQFGQERAKDEPQLAQNRAPASLSAPHVGQLVLTDETLGSARSPLQCSTHPDQSK